MADGLPSVIRHHIGYRQYDCPDNICGVAGFSCLLCICYPHYLDKYPQKVICYCGYGCWASL